MLKIIDFMPSEKTPEEQIITWLKYGVLVVIGIWFLFSTVIIVSAGQRGVVLKFGAVEDKVLTEGLHFVVPIMNSVQILDVRTQKYEVNASASTKDLLDVATTVAINYHLNPSSVNQIYQTIGLDFENRLIAPAVQEVVKSTTAEYNAEELITERPLVKQNIEDKLRERLASRDIIIETISITNFQFPEKFNQAIIDKQTAVQLKQKAENDLERIKVEAQQVVAKAQGEAEAVKIINEQLLKSPLYLQYLAIQKWNGIMPLATGGTLPFINIPTTSP